MTSLYNIVLLQIGIVGAGLKMQRERELVLLRQGYNLQRRGCA